MPEPLTPDRFDFEKLFTVPNAEPLPDDGPGDDGTDAGMMAREQSYQQADDVQWLLDGARKPADSMEGQDALAESDDGTGGLRGLAGAAAMDMGFGAVEGPRQIVGGMRDTVQSIIDMGDVLEQAHIPFTDIPLALGGVTFTDEQGNFSLDYKNADEWRALTEGGMVTEPDLPTVREPSTVTGGAIRSITQFMTGIRLA